MYIISLIKSLANLFLNIIFLFLQKADILVAFLPIINGFREDITYSTSIDRADWMVIMKRPEGYVSINILITPFEILVWILILISIPLMAFCLYFIEITESRVFVSKNKVTLSTCFWFTLGVILREGYSIDYKDGKYKIH